MSRAPVSISLGQKVRPNPRLLRGGAFDGSDDEATPVPVPKKHERAPTRTAPRVIEMRAHDWREERKKRMGILDRHASALGRLDQGYSDNTPETAFTEPQERGLHVKARESVPGSGSEPEQDLAAARDATPPMASAGDSPMLQGADPSEADAIKSLLADASGAPDPRATQRIIVQSEEQQLRHDVDSRPEAPCLEAYSSMPIEEFGAAMLRGMGWRDGQGAGPSRSGPLHTPDIKLRPALLGLGAKARPPTTREDRRYDNKRYMPAVRGDDKWNRSSTSDDRYRSDGRYRRDDRHRSEDRYRNRDHKNRDYRRDANYKDRPERYRGSRDSER